MKKVFVYGTLMQGFSNYGLFVFCKMKFPIWACGQKLGLQK